MTRDAASLRNSVTRRAYVVFGLWRVCFPPCLVRPRLREDAYVTLYYSPTSVNC